MDLEERVLEDIFRGLAGAGEADEESEQGVVVALDEQTECAGVLREVILDQLGVCAHVRILCHSLALVWGSIHTAS